MATAFCASSSTFFSSGSGSPAESAPASAGVPGAGGQGAVSPPGHGPCTPHPVPLLTPWPWTVPYVLPLPGGPCRPAGAGSTPSWLGRERSTWQGQHTGARPLPVLIPAGGFAAHLHRALLRGGSPGLPLYTLPQAPPGLLGQRSGAPGLAGGSAAAAGTVPRGWSGVGKSADRGSSRSARVRVCTHACAAEHTGEGSPGDRPGARG